VTELLYIVTELLYIVTELLYIVTELLYIDASFKVQSQRQTMSWYK